MSPYFDAHSHLHSPLLAAEGGALLAQLERLPVAECVVNGTHPDDWPAVASLAESNSWIRPSFGLHPWEAGNRPPGWESDLRNRLESFPEAAVGEIGLDGWMLKRARPDDRRLAGKRRAALAEQIQVLDTQWAIAVELERPVTLHCLDAWSELLAWAQRAPRHPRGFLLHAFAGPTEQIQAWTALGAYFSFNGAWLDPQRARARQGFGQTPPERWLMETDAPAMRPPLEWRTHTLRRSPDGEERHHPANIEATYAGWAAECGRSLTELTETVEENHRRLFGPPRPALARSGRR